MIINKLNTLFSLKKMTRICPTMTLLKIIVAPKRLTHAVQKYLHTMSATSVFLLSIILWQTVFSGVMNPPQEFQSMTAFPAILVFHR